MSVELIRPTGDEFHLSDAAWDSVESLVTRRDWSGSLERGASLAREEAAALADAFERGLADIASESIDDEVLTSVFSRRSAEHWQSFIDFCRRGGFRIR